MIPGTPQRGARFQTIRSGRRLELLLETHEPGAGLRCWTVSADPEDARWIEEFPLGGKESKSARTAGPAHAAGMVPFVRLCRARLEGGRCSAFDRPSPTTLRLTVDTTDGPRALVLELHRPYPNLLLLDEADRVLGAMRPGAAARRPVPGEPLPEPAAQRPFPEDPPRAPPATQDKAWALHERWRGRLAERDLAYARVEGARLTRRAIERLERRLEHLDADRVSAAAAGRFQRWGELLKIHGSQWRPGAAVVQVPDEFAEGRPEVAIPVDPALSLADNIAALFRGYRKRQGAAEHVERRLAATGRELALVRVVAAAVAEAGSAEGIQDALRAFPGKRSTREPSGAPGAPMREGPLRGGSTRGIGPLERVSSDGLTILVGRSAEENDRLTFRIAKGRDWWLHALGFPGSHVVVRNPAGGPLPPRTLREAAWLAAHYSKARNQGQVEVGYVERKHVRRVPKGKPGLVTYAHGKTLWVDAKDARLRQVLGPAEADVPLDERTGETH